ncbi:tetratricopeptide repeat protein [Erythrobacter sp. THAF29]|uniref:tetratricopeptide repeat protein n=1 Tax=Erythrobacter sp. THAF29 TaxID=2587851 RepID=UPI001268211F|nr:tetratricopeptide repeat protein [Erythrobacter sp. THAF29]QFT77600.1 Tetratricopeptide repeat protein [Erythrobacter sp. THAF29]
MIKGAIKALAPVAAIPLLAVAAPATANVEMPVDAYQSNIAKAKTLMVQNPTAALDLARGARHFIEGETMPELKDRLIANWLEGEALMRLNRPDEAAKVIRPALVEAEKSWSGDKVYADLLRSAASLEGRAGNSDDALDYFLRAQERYEKLGDTRSQAIVLQNIGSLYSRAGDFEQVLKYYRKAAEVFTDDAILSLSAHNNIGNALRGLGRYAEAEAEFIRALEIARKMKSPILEARILTNLASALHLQGDGDEAETIAVKALGLAKEHAEGWKPFVYGVLAQIELGRGNIDKADDYISLTFADQRIEATTTLFRDFHGAAAKIFAEKGKSDLAAKHSAALDRLESQTKKIKNES